MVLRRGEMCLLKCVMRDITNPQYWAKLSLNPLMIVIFSLVHAWVFINPSGETGVGEGPGWGAGPLLEAEAWDPGPPPTFHAFSEVAGPGGWVHAGLPPSAALFLTSSCRGRGTGRGALLLWPPQQRSSGWAHREPTAAPTPTPAVQSSWLQGCLGVQGLGVGGGRALGQAPGL